MANWKFSMYPELYTGLSKEANNDLYRLKHHMPLDNETHERFIATKVPQRRNKDYRARLRNYVAGYPVNLLITNNNS